MYLYRIGTAYRHAVHVYVNDSFIGLHRFRDSRGSRAKIHTHTKAKLSLIAPFFRLAPRRRRRRRYAGARISKREYNLSHTSVARLSRPSSRRLLRTTGKTEMSFLFHFSLQTLKRT